VCDPIPCHQTVRAIWPMFSTNFSKLIAKHKMMKIQADDKLEEKKIKLFAFHFKNRSASTK
jgi:hypothetical protein